MQQFQVKPSEPDKEGPYIARNIDATREAYGIADTKVTQYDANLTLQPRQLQPDASSIPGVRLLDPALVSRRVRAAAAGPRLLQRAPVLDVDRYTVDGKTRDIVIAARELDQVGLPDSQRNWANEHTVYTHGYGVVAAYGNQSNAEDQPVTDNDGKPVWAEQDLPPQGVLTDMFKNGYQPRIYFGENSPNYSIVGQAPSGKDLEFDLPEGTGSGGQTNTYDGKAGVPIGGLFNKLLYAVKFSEPNLVLSSRVNENSKILYDRTPRERVQKVAPWLTVDGDSYPAVVDGRVKWILDGYTTTDHYPNSAEGLAAVDDLGRAEPQHDVRHAADRRDQLHAQLGQGRGRRVRRHREALRVGHPQQGTDPILKAWEGAFPGVVKPKSSIPPDLLEHMRYPEDLFKVQRNMLAAYHVTDAEDVLRRRRPVEGAGGPGEQGQQAAAVPALGARRRRAARTRCSR